MLLTHERKHIAQYGEEAERGGGSNGGNIRTIGMDLKLEFSSTSSKARGKGCDMCP